jgi:preprotein translocase subunit SecG
VAIILGICKFVYFFICFLLIVVVLLQQSKGGGVGGLFGGGSVDSAFGTRAGTVLGKTTAVLACLFFLLAIFIGIQTSGGGRRAELPANPLPPATGAPAPDKNGSTKEGEGSTTVTVPIPEKKEETPAPDVLPPVPDAKKDEE